MSTSESENSKPLGLVTPEEKPEFTEEKGLNFWNMTYLNRPGVHHGWQLKFKAKGREYQPFFSAVEHGNAIEALKHALRARNQLYTQFGYPGRLLRRELSLSVPSTRTSSGRHGVYLRQKQDRRRDTTHDVVSVTFRRQINGKPSTKEWPLSRFTTLNKGVKEAAAWRNAKVMLYNEVVQEFNELMLELRIKPALEKEAELLYPWLPIQVDSDGTIWDEAVRRVQAREAQEGEAASGQ